MLHVLNAAGRQVSLLNEEPPVYVRPTLNYRPTSRDLTHSYSYTSQRSTSSSPTAPELLRSDSYDSQTSSSNEPLSPLTPPTAGFEYPDPLATEKQHIPPSYISTTSDEDVTSPLTVPTATPSLAEKSAKRYPCRYHDSHGCEKTFTTSGHASRHSKIHTAEKAVNCSFPNCLKKFTRADNMKQHLETHFKDKSRSAYRVSKSRERRISLSSRTSSSYTAQSRDMSWDGEQYPLPTPDCHSPLPSPTSWNVPAGSSDLSLPSRPIATRKPSGLDALAIIACQEDISCVQ